MRFVWQRPDVARTFDRGELAREVASISADNQTVETYQHCPKCGAERFTQHAVRDDDPPG